MLSRITVAICGSMAGVGDERRLSSGGTGFLAISGITYFSEFFSMCLRTVISGMVVLFEG